MAVFGALTMGDNLGDKNVLYFFLKQSERHKNIVRKKSI